MKKVEQDKAQKFESSEQEALFNTFKISRRVAEDIAGCMDETGRQELEAWLQESDEHKRRINNPAENMALFRGTGGASIDDVPST